MKVLGDLRWLTILYAVFMVAGTRSIPAQTTGASQDASPYRGNPVTDPEGLSGLWETSNGHGGFVGIHMMLGTTVAPDAKTDGRSLDGVEQRWEYLNLGVYEQRGPEFVLGDAGYFSDRSKDSGLRIENGHLRLHYVSRAAGLLAVDLDLMKEGDRWVGRFHRGSFDERVTLERPGAELKRHDEITGTWTEERFQHRVVHVGEQAPGQFVSWADLLQIPGTIGLANGIQPQRLFQAYGDRVKVQRAGERGVLFEYGAYSVMGGQRSEAGLLSADGKTIESRGGRARWVPFDGVEEKSGVNDGKSSSVRRVGRVRGRSRRDL